MVERHIFFFFFRKAQLSGLFLPTCHSSLVAQEIFWRPTRPTDLVSSLALISSPIRHLASNAHGVHEQRDSSEESPAKCPSHQPRQGNRRFRDARRIVSNASQALPSRIRIDFGFCSRCASRSTSLAKLHSVPYMDFGANLHGRPCTHCVAVQTHLTNSF
jgi:hypothetical protein